MKTSSLFKAAGAARAVAGALVLFLCVGAVSAQGYKEAKVDEALAGQKSAVIGGGDAAAVKNFLTKYYLARWTVQANGASLHTYREELIADGAGLSGAAQDTFLKEAVDALTKYAASKDCYPACRYNAVLAIGTLDVKAPQERNGVGTPYSGAIKTLANFCTSDKEFPDYVRLGALVGLTRHAALGIEDETLRNGVRKVFSTVLDSKYATEKKLRPEIGEWFQLKALEGLTSFKSPEGADGPTGTLDLFKKMIDDDKLDFELRALAARGIGSMDLTKVQNWDATALATSLTTLARDFCISESAHIDSELLREQVKSAAATTGAMGGGAMSGGPGGAMGGGAIGGAGAQQSQKSLEAMVARVQYGFDSVQAAIKGVDGGSGLLVVLGGSVEKKPGGKKAPVEEVNIDPEDKVAVARQMLNDVLQEIQNTNKFVAEGPQNQAGMMGMGGAAMMQGGRGVAGGVMVDSASMKDHLLQQKLRFNALLGVDSF
ncbi:MAG: hypothetical protein IKW13_04610 [Thermoguttaceae bacterium]|nr:hypothetical protein [Thermoguttaceae bacterium]